MKKLFAFFLISTIFMLGLAPNVIGKSYPMKCKSGTKLKILIAEGVMIIDFIKAKDRNNLRPGECSWIDRKINQNEPDFMFLTGKSNLYITRRNRITKIVFLSKNFQQLWNAVTTNGKEFIVYVKYDRKKKGFAITKIGI